MTILGSCMSDISEMGLREIKSTVKNLRLNEKKKNRTFVKSEQQVYDVAANETITKTARLSELNSLLNLDKKDNEIVDDGREEDTEEPERKEKDRDAR